MAFSWIDAGKIALGAAQAFLGHLQARQDDVERERDRELILAAIQSMRDQILDTLNVLAVNEFRGDLEGFQSTYAAYDPDPSNPTEENRLARMIDDSAGVLGRLGANLDTVAANPNLALEAWTVYVPLLYLRAQAMAEREFTYGTPELVDSLSSFDMAMSRLTGLLSYLRTQSDKGFGPVVCKPIPDSQDSRVCWYWWGSEQFICGSTRDPRGVDKCQASRRSNMENAYRAFAGVKEITETLEQVHQAREAVDTIGDLHRLSLAGVHVGEIALVGGRLRRIAPSPGRTGPGIVLSGGDWFS